MALHEHRNFSLRDPETVAAISDGDEFQGCNLEQQLPHTAILAGKTGLAFRGCNLINCDLPAGASVSGCNTRQINRCAHLHPKRGLPAEPDNCPHVVDTDTIQGEVGSITVYHREDTRV